MSTLRDPLRDFGTAGENPLWYHGVMTRAAAEKVLRKEPVGTFLVRATVPDAHTVNEAAYAFAVVMAKKVITDTLITITTTDEKADSPRSQKPLFSITGNPNPFNSIAEIVDGCKAGLNGFPLPEGSLTPCLRKSDFLCTNVQFLAKATQSNRNRRSTSLSFKEGALLGILWEAEVASSDSFKAQNLETAEVGLVSLKHFDVFKEKCLFRAARTSRPKEKGILWMNEGDTIIAVGEVKSTHRLLGVNARTREKGSVSLHDLIDPFSTPPKSSSIIPDTATSTSSPKRRLVRAMYSFEAEEPGELAFAKGDIINILDDSNEAWWKGVRNKTGEIGLFPANRVERISEADESARPEEAAVDAASNQNSPIAANAAPPPIHSDKPAQGTFLFTATALADFRPSVTSAKSTELPFRKGDTLFILDVDTLDPAWWRAEHCRTRQIGFVPASLLETPFFSRAISSGREAEQCVKRAGPSHFLVYYNYTAGRFVLSCADTKGLAVGNVLLRHIPETGQFDLGGGATHDSIQDLIAHHSKNALVLSNGELLSCMHPAKPPTEASDIPDMASVTPRSKWAADTIDEIESETLLRGLIDGAFLVRRKRSGGSFRAAIVFVVDQGIRHIRIQKAEDYYDLFGGDKFATLVELVTFYTTVGKESLREKDGRQIRLVFPYSCAPKHVDIANEPWFLGLDGFDPVPLKSVEQLLAPLAPNSFLVQKMAPSSFVIRWTTNTVDKFGEAIVETDAEKGCFRVGSNDSPNIKALVALLQKNGFKLPGDPSSPVIRLTHAYKHAPKRGEAAPISKPPPRPKMPLPDAETRQRVDDENQSMAAVIKEYLDLSGNAEAESGPLNKVTVIFIGEGRSGKTSTLRSLSGKAFIDSLPSTIGAETEAMVTVDRLDLANWKEVVEGNELRNAMLAIFRAKQQGIEGNSAQELVAMESKLVEAASNDAIDHLKSSFDDPLYQNTSNTDINRVTAEVSSPTHTPPPVPKKMQRLQSRQQEHSRKTTPSTDSRPPVIPHMHDHIEEHELRRSSLPPPITPRHANAPKAVHSSDLDQAISKCAESVLVSTDTETGELAVLTMRIFDLGGQSSFYVFHPFFITSHAVFPCVVDMEALLNEGKRACAVLFLKQWLATLHLHAPGAPILVVGTHADKVTDRTQHEMVSSILHEAFRDNPVSPSIQYNSEGNLWFWPVDNTKSDRDSGIQSLRKAITDAASKLPVMKLRVPLRWMALYEHLKKEHEENGASMMTISEVTAIAAGYEMNEPDVRLCLQFLHKLGFVLHYHKIPGMSDVVVLDIQWAVNMMTRIIRSFDLHHVFVDDEARKHSQMWLALVNHGQLHQKLLRVLWNDIAAATQDAFLDLMVRYGLVMPLHKRTGRQHHSIAPAMTRHSSPPTLSLAHDHKQCVDGELREYKNMVLLCPHILNFSIDSTQTFSAWSLSNHAAMAMNVYDPIAEHQAAHSTVYVAFSLAPFEATASIGSAAFKSVKELQKKAFVPEGLFARVAGLVAAMNSQDLSTPAQISRTQCLLVIEEDPLSLLLVPALGAIRVETPAARPTFLFRMVLDVIRLVLAEAYPSLHTIALLPHSPSHLLLFEDVVFASQLNKSLFIGLERVEAATLRSCYGPWLPATGQQAVFDAFISYRQNVNSQFALSLHRALDRFQHVVLLDGYNLEVGLDFKISFMTSICNSLVVCPLVSAGAISRMARIVNEAHDFCDNVLLEWWCNIALAELAANLRNKLTTPEVAATFSGKVRIQRVVPLILSNTWSNSNVPKSQIEADTFDDLLETTRALPDVVSYETMRELNAFFSQTFGGSYEVKPMTVREIVAKMFNFNAVVCWDAADAQLCTENSNIVPSKESAKLDKRERMGKYAQQVHDVVVKAKDAALAEENDPSSQSPTDMDRIAAETVLPPSRSSQVGSQSQAPAAPLAAPRAARSDTTASSVPRAVFVSPLPMREWTVDTLCEWLTCERLPFAIEPFKANGIDGASFLEDLTKDNVVDVLGFNVIQASTLMRKRQRYLDTQQ